LSSGQDRLVKLGGKSPKVHARIASRRCLLASVLGSGVCSCLSEQRCCGLRGRSCTSTKELQQPTPTRRRVSWVGSEATGQSWEDLGNLLRGRPACGQPWGDQPRGVGTQPNASNYESGCSEVDVTAPFESIESTADSARRFIETAHLRAIGWAECGGHSSGGNVAGSSGE
jgi:hypothetical protein